MAGDDHPLRSGWKYFGAALTTLASLVFYLFPELVPISGKLEQMSYDLPFFLRRTRAVDEAAIIYLDALSHEEMKQPFSQPWDRAIHANLLDLLKTNHSRAVVFDILFEEPFTNKPDADEQFARAIANHGKVILAAENQFNRSVPGLPACKVVLPYHKFAKAAAGWGNVQLPCGPDYAVRKQFPVLLDLPGYREFPTLAWQTAEAVQAPATRDPKAKFTPRWLNYYGPPGAIPSVPYFLNFIPGAVPADFFSNKVVFVGARQSADYSGKGKDEFATPYSLWCKEFAPGVEIHATALVNLLKGDWLTRFPPAVELALQLAIGGFLGWALMQTKPFGTLILACGSMAGVTVFAHLMVWKGGVWMNWCIVAAIQIPLALFWSLFYSLVRAQVEKLALGKSLALHLPGHRVKQILKNPSLLAPGAVEQEVSILFTDIAYFSRIMERASQERLVPLLNKYFQTTITSIHQNQGTVIKLIGDAIFAVWNAPEPQANHADLACQAAISLRKRIGEFNQENQVDVSFLTRLGLHTDQVYVGNFGSTERIDYTAIGKGVNLAARLEGANKTLGTDKGVRQ